MSTELDAEIALKISLASDDQLRWAQEQVTQHHYLRTPVDPRCSPVAYIIRLISGEYVGCLIFGRPESTRCYDPTSRLLTYGSHEDVLAGRCVYDRWELINLARVWLDPIIQKDGRYYVPRAASTMINKALARIGFEYLKMRPPVDCSHPYQLRVCLSYCDTRIHTGYLYRAARFKSARINQDGIETFIKKLPPLTLTQDHLIKQLSEQHPRSRRIRQERHNTNVFQTALDFAWP